MKNKIAVHCKTKKEWKKVLEYIESLGIGAKWGVMGKPTEKIHFWDIYKEETCLDISNLMGLGFCYKSWFQKEKYRIIPVDKYLKKSTPPMNRKQFIQSIENTYKEALEILKIKNSDYANSDNPFKNFEFADLVGVGVEKAILVRMSDKLARISNLTDKAQKGQKAEVKDETILDTLLDIINYSAILKAYLENE